MFSKTSLMPDICGLCMLSTRYFSVALTQHLVSGGSIDDCVSYERTIEALRDRLQQADFDLCQVSRWGICCYSESFWRQGFR